MSRSNQKRNVLRQLSYLVRQELRSALRSRYIFLSFVILPIFIWILQGFVPLVMVGVITGSTAEGEVIHVTNLDDGVITWNNQSISLGEYFISKLNESTLDNNSLLYKARIKFIDFEEGDTGIRTGDVKFWLLIPENFSSTWNNTSLNSSSVVFRYRAGENRFTVLRIQQGIENILSQPPFTIIHIIPEKSSILRSEVIQIEGKQEFNFGVSFFSFFAVLLAVLAPAPYVSTAFAGEREKKTFESMAALPMSRLEMLAGKFAAGLMLVGIFAISNVVGLILYGVMLKVGWEMLVPESITQGMTADSPAETGFFFETNVMTIVIVLVAMFMTSFLSIGLGIAITSFSKDVRTAESTYQFIMMIPTFGIGMIGMFTGLPEHLGTAGYLLYLIPFTHTVALINKFLFFPASPLELLFHVVYLMGSIVVVFYIAAKIYERESIFD